MPQHSFKYGWLIAIIALILSTAINIISIAGYSGRIEQSLGDVRERVDRLEHQMDNYIREVRGLKQ